MFINKFEINEDGIFIGGVLKLILWCLGKVIVV